MAANEPREAIAHRRFSEEDQERFAHWTGDRNPMHLDPVAARRTHAGAPVVYGILMLLWAFDELYRAEPTTRYRRSIRVEFKKYVFVFYGLKGILK